jgi:hypothetical protein
MVFHSMVGLMTHRRLMLALPLTNSCSCGSMPSGHCAPASVMREHHSRLSVSRAARGVTSARPASLTEVPASPSRRSRVSAPSRSIARLDACGAQSSKASS